MLHAIKTKNVYYEFISGCKTEKTGETLIRLFESGEWICSKNAKKPAIPIILSIIWEKGLGKTI